MTRFLVSCQKFTKRIGQTTILILYALRAISIFLGRKNQVDLSRFISANTLPYTEVSSDICVKKSKQVELVIVASAKDFDMFKFTIPAAIEALGQFYGGKTRLVVPDNSVKYCSEKVSDLGLERITVISEDLLINESHRDILRKKFGQRYGWALQQFLKVSQVEQTSVDASLVLDADTILLSPRKWFDSDSRQILFPSVEYHPPYYELLNSRNIGEKIPKFTFVTHHMLMQKSLMREALDKIGARDVHQLIDIVARSTSYEESAFCIEYELYGQYLFNHRPESFFLERWSNRGIARREINHLELKEIKKEYAKYASISAHDYLTQ